VQDAEIILSALPHGVSGRYVHEARAGGKRAVDLSADFRLSPDAVYGLTEFTRRAWRIAELVANPGCYPTAALLALIPLAAARTHRSRAGNHHRRGVGRDRRGAQSQA